MKKAIITGLLILTASAAADAATDAQIQGLGTAIYCMDGGKVHSKTTGENLSQQHCEKMVMDVINTGAVTPAELDRAEMIAKRLYQQERGAEKARSDETWAAVQQNARPQNEGMQWRTVCLAGRGCTVVGGGDW